MFLWTCSAIGGFCSGRAWPLANMLPSRHTTVVAIARSIVVRLDPTLKLPPFLVWGRARRVLEPCVISFIVLDLLFHVGLLRAGSGLLDSTKRTQASGDKAKRQRCYWASDILQNVPL